MPEVEAPTGRGLGVGTLARRLGVAPTTLRSWHQRYGLGPTGHQIGRHRRYTPHDVTALTVMARLTARGVPASEAARQARGAPAVLRAPDVAAASPAEPGAWPAVTTVATGSAVRGLARAARRMDVPALREALAAAVAAYGVVRTWHTLVGPAFARIGAACYDEPRKEVARRVLGQCLREVLATVPRPSAGARVLLVAVGARRDVTAVDAVAAALAERGIASVNQGTGLPPAALTDAVARSRPAVVVVWCHEPRRDLRTLVAAVAGPTVVAAGEGWPATGPGDIVAAPTLAAAVAAAAGLGGAGNG